MAMKKFAACWKYFQNLSSLRKIMKSTVLKIILILVVILLQACSFSGRKKIEPESIKSANAHSVEQGVARDIGRLAVGDSLTSNMSNDVAAREYLVVEAYTAASGKKCREIDIRELDGSEAIESADLCQKRSGHWYWPRDVIFK